MKQLTLKTLPYAIELKYRYHNLSNDKISSRWVTKKTGDRMWCCQVFDQDNKYYFLIFDNNFYTLFKCMSNAVTSKWEVLDFGGRKEQSRWSPDLQDIKDKFSNIVSIEVPVKQTEST